ncbi:MAG: Holliday junction branch migration protein RuvA [bacterium]|nr:Holliday junction branch migration protein RuvA [bacterium]
MIAFLSGILDEKFLDRVFIDVQGVGYLVYIPATVYNRLPEKGAEIKIYTYFHVREDAHVLYGFLANEEVEFFKLLLKASGIGPKSALKILSSVSVYECQKAILQNDVQSLTNISGIGKKTAEKLIIELKDKIKNISFPEQGKEIFSEDTAVNEAILALQALGYKLNQAKQAVLKARSLVTGKHKAEDLIKTAFNYI